jgi:hypothetical protein
MGATLFTFVEADTASVLRVTLVNKQTLGAIDLTGSTVRLIYTIDDGSTQSRVMTLVTPLSGICEYQFVTGDLTPGKMIANTEITFSDTTILSQLDSFTFQVRAKL